MTLGILAGEAKPALVVDLETPKARRVLEADIRLMMGNHTVKIDGTVMETRREGGTNEALYLDHYRYSVPVGLFCYR
ncbi:hypothetical protein B1F84_11990 [Pseudoalteromonas sp. DL-6]|nr:hypothetical protein B1F84_11990 [Pseudoalteromonas sp. DL-6]